MTENIESTYMDQLNEAVKKQETLAINKLEAIVNLPEMVEVLKKTKSFTVLGEALTPLTVYQDTQKPKEKPLLLKRETKLSAWLKSKRVKPLDALAGAFTTLIWGAASGWIIQSFHLTYSTAIGLGVFWLCYIVVFRLVIGGILD